MATGDRYKAVGGAMTLPTAAIKVTGGACEKQTLGIQNITGPGDNGNPAFEFGNIQRGFSLRGVYVEESDNLGDDDDARIMGSATIAIGSGETWSGDVIIRRVRSSADWGPGGAIGVTVQGVFTGEVSVGTSS